MTEIIFTGDAAFNLLKFALLLLPPWAFGVAVALRLKGTFYFGERLMLGLALGLTVFVALGFLVSFLSSFHWSGILAVEAVLAGSAICLYKFPVRAISLTALSPQRLHKVDRGGLVVFAGGLVIFTLIMQRLLVWNDGSLATGYLDAWGDLPLHLSLITAFTSDSKLMLENTILAGEPLTYPFMSDFFSAILMQFRIPLEHTIEWPGVFMNSVTVTLLYYLSYRLVRDRRAALLVPVLLLLAGGFGFWWFLKDVYFSSQPVWEVLQDLPRRYTKISEVNIQWVNPTLAHLIPQRSFLFGFPIGLSVILLWWQHFARQQTRQAWAPALLMGMLPLFHTHTFLTLSIAGVALVLLSLAKKDRRRQKLRYWLGFAIVAGILAGPQLIYLLSSKISLNTIRFYFGWMAEGEHVSWFWLKNLGLFIPVLILVLFLREQLALPKKTLWFYLPFGLLFVVGNLFLFAPFAYDNNKILIYWYLLTLPLVARLLVALYDSKSWWVRAFVFRLLLISLIFSGSLNLLHEFQNDGWEELTAEEVNLAREVRNRTNDRATFLSAPVHNNLPALAGRSVVLGYPGHVFSHGYDYTQREKIIEEIYTGREHAAEHLQSLRIDYVLVGPHERQKYAITQSWFEDHFTVFTRSENYAIYQIAGKDLPKNLTSRKNEAISGKY